MEKVRVVRIYISEHEKLIQPILHYLHNGADVRGVTVFRGIAGFGESGKIHGLDLIDVSFDLPICIEFFESPKQVTKVIDHLSEMVAADHIVMWDAECK